jgi:hypothetical protein
MPTKLGAEYWRERAEEARIQADQMRNPMVRKTLIEIAENYEQLAQQAERLRLTGSQPKQAQSE